MEKDKWPVWTFRWLLMTAILIGGWFAQEIWQGQKTIVNRLNAMDVNTATASASKFTASDWAAAKAAIDAQFNINERRIFKLENLSDQISKSLDEIKQNTKRP